jgi:hypothetical protein
MVMAGTKTRMVHCLCFQVRGTPASCFVVLAFLCFTWLAHIVCSLSVDCFCLPFLSWACNRSASASTKCSCVPLVCKQLHHPACVSAALIKVMDGWPSLHRQRSPLL